MVIPLPLKLEVWCLEWCMCVWGVRRGRERAAGETGSGAEGEERREPAREAPYTPPSSATFPPFLPHPSIVPPRPPSLPAAAGPGRSEDGKGWQP